MKTIITSISIIILATIIFGAVKGFDLKTMKGFLFVFWSFVSGLLIGLSTNRDLSDSIFFGLLIALLVAYTGLSNLRINRWASKYYKEHFGDE